MGVGAKIKEYAKKQGISLRQLSIQADVPYSTLYSAVQRDSNSMNIEILKKIAYALGTHLPVLLSADEVLEVLKKESANEVEFRHNAEQLLGEMEQEADKFLEEQLLAKIGRLNTDGKEKVAEYIEDLLEVSKYQEQEKE